MTLPKEIGIKLVCPACRRDVLRHNDSYVCTFAECRLRYAIVDEIPKFLVEEAAQLSPEDWSGAMETPESLTPE